MDERRIEAAGLGDEQASVAGSTWRPRLLPWRQGYSGAALRADAVAGLTTAVMLVPQAMAYALLAGLPPIVGLYAATVPGVVYAVFGGARQLSVGPVALDSLMVAAALGAVGAASGGLSTGEAVAAAAALALLVGVVQLAMGALRLGALVALLSQPVIAGFTAAAALIIGLSQLEHLLGLQLPRSQDALRVLAALAAGAGDVHRPTLLIGALGVAALVVGRRRWPRLPMPLVLLSAAALAVVALDLQAAGVRVVGVVPAGLPAPAWPPLELARWRALAEVAPAIALVAFLEAISVARAFATRSGERVDADQELLALGAANAATGLFGGYPVTGGLSRSAVNAAAGARSPLAGLFASTAVALLLSFGTAAIEPLPRAALAAIVLVAVASLVDVGLLRRLWRHRRAEAWLMVGSALATLALGVQAGIALGVLASLAHVVVRTTRPHIAELGLMPDGRDYRNIARNEGAMVTPGVVVVRVDMALYFANIDAVLRHVSGLVHGRPGTRSVVLDCSAVNDVDASAAAALLAYRRDLRAAGVELLLARVKGPVLDVLQAEGCTDDAGLRVLATVRDAVDVATGGASFRFGVRMTSALP